MTRRTAIILGNGFRLRSRWRSDGPELRLESRLCALAAAQLLRDGAIERLILSGGHTAGASRSSEADAMARYLRRHAAAQTRVTVLLEETSIDTAGNAEHVARLLGSTAVDDVPPLLVTVDAHLRRAVRLFAARGISVTPLACEAVLRERSEHHRRMLRHYARSGRALLRRGLERLLAPIARMDRDGRAVRLVTRLLRRA